MHGMSDRPRVHAHSLWGAGFTLLETLVVLALLGVLVGLAVPTVKAVSDRHQLQAQAEGLFSSLVLARSEALRRQHTVTLCPRAGQSCDASSTWQQGWLVFVDANRNGRRDEGETLIEAREAMPPAVLIGVTSTVKAYFSYGPEGRSMATSGAFMAGSWRFCRASSTEGWKVVSNALGKPRLEKYTPDPCP
jgi:type IV fimbrial biogenesis protein FimT